MLDAVGQTNAAAWMDHFRLASVDTSARPGRAVLVPTLTFSGGARNVATSPRVKRVADTLTQILAHPMQVDVADTPVRDQEVGPRDGSSPDTSRNRSTSGRSAGPVTSPGEAREQRGIGDTDNAGHAGNVASAADARSDLSPGTAAARAAGPVPMDRRDALSLPLVRDVFEVFPDASLIDARHEPTPTRNPAANDEPPADA